ncbi:MAG: DUF1638 domain-containing protein [Pseudomonadota bacterium]
MVIACGALAAEIMWLCKANNFTHIALTCLPAKWHNTPDKIAPRLEEIIIKERKHYAQILIGYGECGTQGAIDRLVEKYAVTRLPGAHCYAFFAGLAAFDAMMKQEVGSFFLTDYLARFFDSLIIKGFHLEEQHGMKGFLFGNYRRLVYLAQTQDDALQEKARAAATYLGLEYHYHFTGYGMLTPALQVQQEGIWPH